MRTSQLPDCVKLLTPGPASNRQALRVLVADITSARTQDNSVFPTSVKLNSLFPGNQALSNTGSVTVTVCMAGTQVQLLVGSALAVPRETPLRKNSSVSAEIQEVFKISYVIVSGTSQCSGPSMRCTRNRSSGTR